MTHVSVDILRKTAIVRFRYIDSAKKAYLFSREINSETGSRNQFLGEDHPDAQIVYVIPEHSSEAPDSISDDKLSLDRITQMINDKNEEVKSTFKKFCSETQPEEKTRL